MSYSRLKSTKYNRPFVKHKTRSVILSSFQAPPPRFASIIPSSMPSIMLSFYRAIQRSMLSFYRAIQRSSCLIVQERCSLIRSNIFLFKVSRGPTATVVHKGVLGTIQPSVALKTSINSIFSSSSLSTVADSEKDSCANQNNLEGAYKHKDNPA